MVEYLDDIVIYSESLEEHIRHFGLVFSKLKEYVLYVNREKCEFCKKKIKFLGHIITHG